MINDIILSLNKNSPDDILSSIAKRVKARRLEKNWTQKRLAERANIALPTYRRFERTGEISLHGLVMLAIVLEAEDDFETLFSTRTFQNMDELLNAQKNQTRKRATKNG